MDSTSLPAESLLTLDIGTSMTRATLFDIVEDQFRYLASGAAPTTAFPPTGEIRRGIRWALDELSTATGRQFVDPGGRLLRPDGQSGSGADHISATFSIAPPVKVLAVGLSPDFSLASLRRLARSIHYHQFETLGLEDPRKPEEQVDAILKLRPDLILVAGGSDGGASRSLLALIDTVSLACSIIPESSRPPVIFAGNQSIQSEVESRLGRLTRLVVAPNLRPQENIENLEPAMHQLTQLYKQLVKQRIPWLARLDNLAQDKMLHSGYALGRLMRFLSQVRPGRNGVLGIDLGVSALTVAVAFSGGLSLQIFPEFGMGNQLTNYLDITSLSTIAGWLYTNIPPSFIKEYLLQKSLYPDMLSTTSDALMVEQALARYMLHSGIQQVVAGFSSKAVFNSPGQLPAMEPIFVSGAVLAKAPDLASCLLMLLDGLQPTGITTFVLDHNLIAPSLGAAAALMPGQVVQLLNSDAFLHLATVISPTGTARPGTPVLRVKIYPENDQETSLEVRQGELRVYPVTEGHSARLQLTPLQEFDIGMGNPGRGGSLRVTGSKFGLVFDARGRPLHPPGDLARRSDQYSDWFSMLAT